MTNKLSLLIGIIVLVVLLAYMFTFQVRYDEVAVRTTFDRAAQPVHLSERVVAPGAPAVATGEAVFAVQIDDADAVAVRVPAASIEAIADAVDPVQAARDHVAEAIADAGLADDVGVDVYNNRLRLSLLETAEGATLALPEVNETAQRALGLARHVETVGSLYYEPGLKWRLPPPIQRVYKYSRKLHLLEDEPEQIMTAEGHTVIMRTYATWRIARPYQFFQQLGDVPAAEARLTELMRALRGVISSYRFDELVNNDPEQLRLQEIEEAALEQLRSELASIDPGLGIEVEAFGIRRVLLPGPVSEDVFARMRSTRERMAEDILARGRSEAASIRNEAEATREIILDFASRRAEQIRAEGDAEAARYYEAFADHQDLAIFLREIEALQRMLAHNTTFILDADQLSVLRPFTHGPEGEPEAVEAGTLEAGLEAAAGEPRKLSDEQWEAFQQWQAWREQRELEEAEETGADAGDAAPSETDIVTQ